MGGHHDVRTAAFAHTSIAWSPSSGIAESSSSPYTYLGSELYEHRLQLITPSSHDCRGQAPPQDGSGVPCHQAQQAPGHAPASTGARTSRHWGSLSSGTSSYAGDVAAWRVHVPLAPASYDGDQIDVIQPPVPQAPASYAGDQMAAAECIQRYTGVQTAEHAAWQPSQFALYTAACHKLNTWNLGFEEYLTQFGPMSNSHNGFGDNVFIGLLGTFFERYPHRHKMTGTVRCGWFICPVPFSKANATTPPRSGETMCFPAIFTDGWHGQLTMGCQNLLMDGSRPWMVHAARAINLVVPPAAVMQLQLRYI